MDRRREGFDRAQHLQQSASDGITPAVVMRKQTSPCVFCNYRGFFNGIEIPKMLSFTIMFYRFPIFFFVFSIKNTTLTGFILRN